MAVGERERFVLIADAVVTGVGDTVIGDGAVAVEDGVIVEVGPHADVVAHHRSLRRDPGPGRVAVPGFVNLHVHSALSSTRGVGDDAGTAPIYRRDLPQGVLLDEDDLYWFTQLGVVEAVRLGSTTIVENYLSATVAAEALAATGARAWVSERLHDVDLLDLTDGAYRHDPLIGRRTWAATEELVARWHGHDGGRIRCQVGPHGPDTCSDELLVRARRMAGARGLGMFMHVSQSPREEAQVRSRTGASSVRHLHRLGVLGPWLVAGHCRHVDQDDLGLLVDSGTQVCHMPVANAKAGFVAPVRQVQRRGGNVGIGTDNGLPDMVQAMRIALLVNRVADGGPDGLRAREVLAMATRNGAAALGADQWVGTLEPGRRADIVVLEAGGLHWAPVTDAVANLVFCGNGTDVVDVVIDGRYVVRDGEVLTVDAGRVRREAQRRADRWRAASPARPPAPTPSVS